MSKLYRVAIDLMNKNLIILNSLEEHIKTLKEQNLDYTMYFEMYQAIWRDKNIINILNK